MTDFTHRAEELLNAMESIEPHVNDALLSAHREAVGRYMQARNAILTSLIELVNDESASTDSASRWTALCESLASGIDNTFMAEIRLITAIVGPSALVLGEQVGRAVKEENRFIELLSKVNAALVRDYMVQNTRELQSCTEGLSKAWEDIIKQADEAKQDQTSIYKEIADMAREVVNALAVEEKNLLEKSAEYGAVALDGISHLADIIAEVLKLPEGANFAIEKLSEFLKEYAEEWVKKNKYLLARLEAYRSSLKQEEGGALPIFQSIRLQIYAFWNEKGTRASSVWWDRARASLDDFKSNCPTSGQKEDAEAFTKAIRDAIEARWRKLQDIGKDFETKWDGVFKGALAPTTQERLDDEIAWQQNSDSLIALKAYELGQVFIQRTGEILESGYIEPTDKLMDALQALPDETENKLKLLSAVKELREKIQGEIRDRIKELQSQVRDAIDALEPEKIKTALARDELRKLLE